MQCCNSDVPTPCNSRDPSALSRNKSSSNRTSKCKRAIVLSSDVLCHARFLAGLSRARRIDLLSSLMPVQREEKPKSSVPRRQVPVCRRHQPDGDPRRSQSSPPFLPSRARPEILPRRLARRTTGPLSGRQGAIEDERGRVRIRRPVTPRHAPTFDMTTHCLAQPSPHLHHVLYSGENVQCP